MHLRLQRLLNAPSLTLTLLAACGGGDKNTASDTSASSTATTSSSTAATSSSGDLTTQPTTSTASATGSGDASASETGLPETTTASTTTTAGTTSTAGTTTGTGDGSSSNASSGDASSSGGPVCGGQGDSCAKPGELCCEGFDCCSGVPVPPGKEFCSSDSCPVSDRNAKTGFADIDPGEVLRRVVALPISTWQYNKDEPGVRHLGPMAQDFRAAFGLWDRDTMIFPLDASGVSMAAIQGLHARLLAAEAENEELRARLERLERRLAQ